MQNTLILIILAFLAIIIGAVVMNWLRLDNLRREGARVTATVRNIAHEHHTRMNSTDYTMTTRDQWYVDADWTDPETGVTRSFRSDSLNEWDTLRYCVGSPITVLVDPTNPDSYHVEITR